MKQTIILIIFSLILSFTNAQVKVYSDKSQSSITYSMNHPLHSWIGVSKEVNSIIVTDEIKSTISQVAVSVRIASFDSKNANRDSHAMESTEAIKYPSISFSSSQIENLGNKLKVSGIMQFHGVSQTISFEAEKSMIKDKAKITGNFSITLTQFKIDPPSLLGLAVDDEIKVSFSLVY
jgi:polyisoprenoid-binding protein YceI